MVDKIEELTTVEEVRKFFGYTDEKLEKMERDASEGIFEGEPGKIVFGRPLKFGDELRPVTFKETKQKISEMDTRAASKGMSRSDYLRDLVRRDLAAV
jgi:hypothetical protein